MLITEVTVMTLAKKAGTLLLFMLLGMLAAMGVNADSLSARPRQLRLAPKARPSAPLRSTWRLISNWSPSPGVRRPCSVTTGARWCC